MGRAYRRKEKSAGRTRQWLGESGPVPLVLTKKEKGVVTSKKEGKRKGRMLRKGDDRTPL